MIDNKIQRLNPEGTKEFSYGKPSKSPTKKQQFLIEVIEFAYSKEGVKFTGITTEDAYTFIGKYYPTIEYGKSDSSIYKILNNGERIFIGYLEEQFQF